MPEDPMESYREQIAQHELAKQEGAAAYADAIIDMLPEMDEDKAILIKEGLKAVLGGPPNLAFPMSMHMPPQIDADFVPPPPPYFTDTDNNGVITTYNWIAIAQNITHIRRYANGSLALLNGDKRFLALQDEPAAKFWEWSQYMKGVR